MTITFYRFNRFTIPQELNLLVIFDVIMTEGSITRAAERLSMTQPSVSNAVARMRVLWKDDLFIKDGRSIKPTSFALSFWDKVKDPLYQLNKAIKPNPFDPKTAKRTFRIAASDITIDILWLELRQLFEEQAPGINLHAYPYIIEQTESVLNDAKVDLVLSITAPKVAGIRSCFLFDAPYVCAMRADHPLASSELTLQAFVEADHLFVSLSGDVSGITDQVLMQQGLKRRIAMTVNNFSSVPQLLMDSDLISVLPSGAIHKYVASGQLVAFVCPVDIPNTSLSMVWHKRQDQDVGLKWLRNHIEHTLVPNWIQKTDIVNQSIYL